MRQANPPHGANRILLLAQRLVALSQESRHEEMATLARELVAIAPAHPFGWKALGLAMHRQGQANAALDAMREALRLAPEDADTHYHAGCLLHAIRRLDEAEACYRQALALHPSCVDAALNLGNLLRESNRGIEAEAAYREAIRIQPDCAAAHGNLGVALREQKRLPEAEAALREAIRLTPDDPEAHNNLCLILQDQGASEAATAALREVIRLQPDNAQAHYKLGIALRKQNRLEEAATALREAIRCQPDFAAASNTLTEMLIANDQKVLALDNTIELLKIRKDPTAQQFFVQLIQSVKPLHHFPDCMDFLPDALTAPWTDPCRLMPAGMKILQCDPHLQSVMLHLLHMWPQRPTRSDLPDPDAFATAVGQPVLHILLTSAPIASWFAERFFTQTRHMLLADASQKIRLNDLPEDIFKFYAALAQQNYINDHVWDWQEMEKAQACALRDALDATLAGHAQPAPLMVLAVAAYFPLHALTHHAKLLQWTWSQPMEAVLTMQVRHPLEERRLAATIPRLTPIDDPLSRMVQKQYEENPYPKWQRLPRSAPMALNDYVRQSLPHATFQPLDDTEGHDCLIAGCGTGKHAILRATELRNVRILAIDLSMSSLCYAKRKSMELGLNGIDYAHADIMGLDRPGRFFDLIEAVGVLHHMRDPFAGWRILLGCLRPGGFMRLGFYSAVARENLTRHQVHLKEHANLSSDAIRQIRQEIMHSSSPLAKAASAAADFYDTSSCRDLLFHVQEHRISLMQIKAFIEAQDLRFLGMVTPGATTLTEYHRLFPDDPAATDLDHWQEFETRNPATFRTMYTFFIQKPTNATHAAA
ncbi:MAG: tetratricopeptide repeat protein [Magnetococcales bacterium]|nr:tetratricopeptide repeat protein [Magnetococcales bacterium]